MISLAKTTGTIMASMVVLSQRSRPRTPAHAIDRTTPPSTHSAAPVVADVCGEQT
jgi:hypothetical protein